MSLPTVALLIVLCIGCCNAQQNGNLRVRLSAKVIDVLISTIANKKKVFQQYVSLTTRIEGKIGDVTYMLDPDAQKAELSLELRNFYSYDTQLHRIGGAKFEIGIQLLKTPGNDLNLVLSKCNFTATRNTNTLERAYVNANLGGQGCELFQSELRSVQNTIRLDTPEGLMSVHCKPVAPSGMFQDRIEITVGCTATVGNSAETDGERSIAPEGQLPAMPLFEADQATIEIQSSDSLHDIALLARQPVQFLNHTVTPESTNPIFTQIVPILSQIATATGSDPILNLAGSYKQLRLNNTHGSVVLAIEEKITDNESGYGEGIILHCKINWKLTIQMTQTLQRWLNLRDMQNANVTIDSTNATVIKSTLTNTTISDKLCGQLHTNFNRDQITRQIGSQPQLVYQTLKLFLQDSAMVLKIDIGKMIQAVFAASQPIRPQFFEP